MLPTCHVTPQTYLLLVSRCNNMEHMRNNSDPQKLDTTLAGYVLLQSPVARAVTRHANL